MKYSYVFFSICFVVTSLMFNSCGSKSKSDKSWKVLLDNDLSQWDKFIGVPHYSVDLEGYEKGDGMAGVPIGLNKDPLNVFSTVEIDGELVLRISGEIYGGISTKKEFENYHLTLMYKWGEEKFEPRLKEKRDSGILYHCQEPHGAMWNCWMQSQEMQVQEGDTGDYYTIASTGVDVKAEKRNKLGAKFDIYVYNPESDYKRFKTGEDGRCRKLADYEKLGEWNRLDLVCIGDTSYHIVNGKVVMKLEKSVRYTSEDIAIPLTKGKIQIQSEGAEVYYKDIKITSVKELPKEFTNSI